MKFYKRDAKSSIMSVKLTYEYLNLVFRILLPSISNYKNLFFSGHVMKKNLKVSEPHK